MSEKPQEEECYELPSMLNPSPSVDSEQGKRKNKKLSNSRKELPPVLTYTRSFETGNGTMKQGIWGEGDEPQKNQSWESTKVTNRGHRAPNSFYGANEEDKAQPIPVYGDDVYLLPNKDTVQLNLSTTIMPITCNSCNDPVIKEIIDQKLKEYKDEKTGMEKLAHRYAYNIANGRFIWRNGDCAEKMRVEVDYANEHLSFNPYDFSLDDFDTNSENSDLMTLAKFIYTRLNNDSRRQPKVPIHVTAYIKLGKGQQVFPSQNMNTKEKNKSLYTVDGCAALTSEKINNAIRTIDTWYSNDAKFPIAVEVYGSVTQQGIAYRAKDNDLYTLLEAWINDEPISDNDKNFIVAYLIRGGLCNGKSKKE